MTSYQRSIATIGLGTSHRFRDKRRLPS